MSEMKKVMIVDDDPSIVDSLSAFLKGSYEIETACNGREGLERIRAAKPDIIILDLLMPEKDGFDVCKTLKSDEELKQIPVITLSSFTELYDMRFGAEDTKRALPTDIYLSKPFDPATLLREIKALLG